ncbi:hypothetical protein HanOQP8_Chr13g0480511 [Helianthus annuus]|nr:hypothetical protein HanHA89_Chr13g0511591 [Helianthus annuus]KAJ0663474.1 hypothetical protein HanLR1_Chr13g0481611 [Helianthus annuus]KAJ0670971.1 hypothetical protein HanOQP8_Chr13g0480511 [Helianthus annuus]
MDHTLGAPLSSPLHILTPSNYSHTHLLPLIAFTHTTIRSMKFDVQMENESIIGIMYFTLKIIACKPHLQTCLTAT